MSLVQRALATPGASLILLLVPGFLNAQEAFPGDKGRNEWKSEFVLYIWAANIDATTTVGTTEVPVDVSFGDLWDRMKFAASGHYEGNKGTWGFLLDGSYINLGDDEITVIQGPGPGELEVTADYRFKIYAAEGAVLWSPIDLGAQRLDFLGGLRYNRQDLTLTLATPGPGEPPNQGFDENWVDPMVGIRWGIGWGRYNRWMFRVRSDIGGFGVGSDLALNFAAHFGYRISKTVFLSLGGRYLYTDYASGTIDTDDYFAFKGDQFGILAGLGFRF